MHYIRRAAIFMLGMTIMCPIAVHGAEKEKSEAFISLTRTPQAEKELPTNVTIIRSEQIEKSGAQNVAQVLEKQVGTVLTQTSDLGSLHQIAMRGFSSSRVLFLVDDRPIRNLYTGTIDLSQIDVHNIERIEIVRGAGSALYGPNSEGGVVNIITKRAKGGEPTLELGSMTRSYGTQVHHLNFGLKKERIEGYFSANKNSSTGFRKNSDWDNTSYSADVGYEFPFGGKSELDVSLSQSEVGVPDVAVNPVTGVPLRIEEFDGEIETNALSPFDRQRDKTESLRYQHKYDYEDIFSGKVRVYGEKKSQTFVSYFLGIPSESTNTAIIQGVEAQLDFPRVGFTIGSQVELDKFQSSFQSEIQSTIWGVFAQEKQTFFDRWTVVLGLRGDRNKDYGSSVNPRFSTTFNLNEQWKFSANAGRSFRVPTFADRFPGFGRPPNTTVRPETSWQEDAGVEFTVGSKFRTKVTYFRSDTIDKIVSDAGNSSRADNVSKAYSQGAEVEVNQQILECLSHGANYTFTESLGMREEGISDYFILPLTPKHRANYFVDWQAPFKVTLNSSVNYVDVQYFPNFNGKGQTVLHPYILWNVRVAKKIGPLEAFFGVDNITETRYASNANPPGAFTGFFPQPGRTYWGGVNVKFF